MVERDFLMGVHRTTARRFALFLDWAAWSVASVLLTAFIGACVSPGELHFGARESVTADARAELVLGRGGVDGTGIVIRALDPRGRAMVVFRPPSALTASQKPFVRLSTERIPSQLHLSFIWRRQDEPREPARIPLGQPSGTLTAYLGKHPNWAGKIIEYGVLVEPASSFPPESAELGSINLSNPDFVTGTFGHRLAAFADGLLQPWYWSGSAPNTIPRPDREQRYGMTPFAFSVLCGLMLIGLFGIRNLLQQTSPLTLGTIFRGVALASVLIAGLHTKQLYDQGLSHIHSYAGRGELQQPELGPDWPIQKEAREIEQLLEGAGIGRTATDRVAIITPGGQYRQERLFYHLLPRNTYPWGGTNIDCRQEAVSLLVIDHAETDLPGVSGDASISDCIAEGRIVGSSGDRWVLYRLDE